MTTRAELQAEIAADAIRVIKTEVVPDPAGQAVGVITYDTEILEKLPGTVARTRTIGWFTVDEGTGTEEAYYKDNAALSEAEQDTLRQYLDLLNFEEVKVLSVDRELQFAICQAYESTGTNTSVEKRLLIRRSNGSFVWSDITNWVSANQ